jgi:hypothetical protein
MAAHDVSGLGVVTHQVEVAQALQLDQQLGVGCSRLA